MTPLVQQVARILPSPGDDAHWFDLGYMPKTTMVLYDDVLMHLPYRTCILCGRDEAGNIVGVRAVGAENHSSITFAGILSGGGITSIIEPFALIDTPEGGRFLRAEKTPAEHRELCIGLVGTLTAAASKPLQHYIGQPDQGYTSKKRMAKGKPPLSYTWHTVTLQPPAPPSRPTGGTHASPRLHDRRGHWRNTPSGKRVWVRDCKVGDASKGIVFKDYKIKDKT